jgi:hypothetical protein
MKNPEFVAAIEKQWDHSFAHDFDEPYRGVAALFNADLHAQAPSWAPREEWLVVAPDVLHRPGHVLIDSQYYRADSPEGIAYFKRERLVAEAYAAVEASYDPTA